MSFPDETNWPTSYDDIEERADYVDMAYATDFNFQALQVQKIQQWLGSFGKLIGEEFSALGPIGICSGAEATAIGFKIAVAASMTDGKLLSIVDNFADTELEKLSVTHAGRLWAKDGLDIYDCEFLRIPLGSSLPSTFESGRLFFKTGTDEGLKVANGSTWNSISGTDADAFHKSIAGEISALDRKTSVAGTDKIVIEDSEDEDAKKFIEVDDLGIGEGGGSGAVSESYIIFALNCFYNQLDPPVAEILGQQMFDGSKVSSAQTAKLRICWNPTMITGTSYIRIYDIGPKEGPPTLPVLIKEFSTTDSGLQYDEQALTVSALGPALNTIKNNARIYEVTVFQDGTAGDTIYIGSVTLALEVTSLPTGTELELFDVWAFGGM
jgi:hypothetical protein